DDNFERAREMLGRFFAACYPRHVARDLGIERRHSWRRYRRGMLAVGRIDYACLLENGAMELVDWKTGRRKGGVEDLDQDLQVLFYRSLGAEAYAHLAPRSIRVTLYFLGSGAPLTVDLEREDFEAGWNRIEAIATAIREAMAAVSAGMPLLEAFPPRRGVQCSLCPIGAHCDALASAGKLVVPPEGGAA
ncbi:MAG TPA: PD-(D/E)XK nuclease family protein, partial [Oscillatoriaceae cyanobacterium]